MFRGDFVCREQAINVVKIDSPSGAKMEGMNGLLSISSLCGCDIILHEDRILGHSTEVQSSVFTACETGLIP